MSVVFNEFKTDLDRVRRLLEAIELHRSFQGLNRQFGPSIDPYSDHAEKLYQSSRSCHTDLAILSGTLILYVAGRFEYFVRTIFEDLAETVARECGSYDRLPREMRENLIRFTADVMKDPRKYGHAERGVEAFITALAKNLAERDQLGNINSRCLSITHENMKAEPLDLLFRRIGANDLWEKVGQQAIVQTHFSTDEAGQAKNKAQKLLNDLMDDRNKIAHPSADVTWPDATRVTDYIEFLEVLGNSIVQVCGVYEVSLPNRTNAARGTARARSTEDLQRPPD